MVKEILKLGNPKLYEASEPVTAEDLPKLPGWIADLHDTMMQYRRTYGAGRAIAAPQIGVQKRLIYLFMGEPHVFVNPTMTFPDGEQYTLLDDCMSFPGLKVWVKRYKRAVIDYFDENMQPRQMRLEGDWAELLQHEYDHLDGMLATMRAVDEKSFVME